MRLAKLDDQSVREIRKLSIIDNLCNSIIAEKFNITKGEVRDIVNMNIRFNESDYTYLLNTEEYFMRTIMWLCTRIYVYGFMITKPDKIKLVMEKNNLTISRMVMLSQLYFDTRRNEINGRLGII